MVNWRVMSQQIWLIPKIKCSFVTLKKCFYFYPSPELRKDWTASSLPKSHSFLNTAAKQGGSCNSMVSQKHILVRDYKALFRGAQGRGVGDKDTLEWVSFIIFLKEEAVKSFCSLCSLICLLPATLLLPQHTSPISESLVHSPSIL